MLTEYMQIRTSPVFASDSSLFTKLREGTRKAGIVNQSYGLGIEEPGTLHWLVHFDQGFLPQDLKWPEAEYGNFNEKVGEIAEGSLESAFLPFEEKPFPRQTTDAAVTEVVTFEVKEGVQEQFAKAIENMLAGVLNAKGSRSGVWRLAKGDARKAYAFVGWDSIEDHVNFAKTYIFKELQGELGAQVNKASMVHVKFVGHV